MTLIGLLGFQASVWAASTSLRLPVVETMKKLINKALPKR
jgi:hypothetical protein